MSLQHLSSDFAVVGQITPDDVPAIAEAGFKSIVCNRPDGEGGPGQPSYAAIEQAAKAAGLEVRNLPVVSGSITPEQVAAMADMLDELPTPVLAYCRSGARSTNLWQMAKASRGR
jgi:sulfide:quinone oxidoreductase